MSRSVFLTLIAFAVFISSIISLLINIEYEVFALRGYVDPTADPNLPFRVPRFGVNTQLEQYTENELETHLARMEASSVVWVRQFVYWNEIELRPGEFDWSTWDSIVTQFKKHHQLRLIAVLMNSPEWSRHNLQRSFTSPPADSGTFANFAHAFATRYGTLIDHYQIWDEPNLWASWGDSNPSPIDYAALLASTYDAIHTADANAIVIAAALAPTTENGPQNLNEMQYLRDLYAVGAQNYFDAIAGKPYGFSLSPLDRTVNNATLNFSRLIGLREIMAEHGDAKKAVWAMNWGWNNLPENWTGSPSIWGKVTLDEQINYTLGALDRIEREWPWLAGMIIQHWQPDAALDNPIWGFSLLRPDGNPNELLEAIQSRIVPSYGSNGLFEPTTRYATYRGVWSFGPLGADSGWVDGSQAEFAFQGTSVSLLLREGNYVGYIYPKINGQYLDALPHDNTGNAYIVLTSGSGKLETNLTNVVNNLPNGNYTLKLVADRGWDQWPLVGYAVSSGDLRQPYKNSYSISLVSLMLSSIFVLSLITVQQRQKLVSFNRWLSHYCDGIGKWLLAGVASISLLIGLLLTWGEGIPAIFRRELVQIGVSILTAGLIYVQVSVWVTLISIFILWWLIFIRIEVGLALTIFWAPFFLFPVELFQFAFPLSEVIILLTMSSWILRASVSWLSNPIAITWDRTKHIHALDVAVLVWLALGAISLLWSEYKDLAFTEFRVKFVEPAFFYLIFRAVSRTKASIIRYCLIALILAGTIVSLIGLIQFIQGQAIITAEAGTLRMASVYGSPNNLSLFLGRCLPFVLAGMLMVSRTSLKVLFAVIISIMGMALLLSQSAGALFMGIPAAVSIVLALSLKTRRVAILFMMIAVSLVAIVIALQFPRFSRLADFSSGTNFYRLRVWESAIDMIRDHPITGIGLDQFLNEFRSQYIRPDAWQEPNLSHPHNIILDFWLQLGIAGVVILIIMQYRFWSSIWQSYTSSQNNTNSFHRILIIGAMGSMANLVVHGFVDNSVYVNDLVYIFMFLLAIAAVEKPLANQIKTDAKQSRPTLP